MLFRSASPPYLHNGSAPTLHDLLSPTRPEKFTVGGREYDPVKVGFDTSPIVNGQTFDTTSAGNSNKGHWFANDDRPGRVGPELSEADRAAIIEYLKSASYADYPCFDALTNDPKPVDFCHR